MRSVNDLASSLAPLKDMVGLKEYRDWAYSPATIRYLGIVADILTPPPVPDEKLLEPVLVASALIRRELVESFIDLALKLDKVQGAQDDQMPDADYGADQMLLDAKKQLAAVLKSPVKTETPAGARPASTPKRRKKNEQ